MSFLSILLNGYNQIDNDGVEVDQRNILNIKAGTGITLVIADNPSLQSTDLTITGDSGSGISALVADVSATGPGISTATVQGIRGRTVASTPPADASLLVHDSPTSTWNPRVASGDVTLDSAGAFTVVAIQGFPISTTAPTSSQVLAWDGSEWKPSADASGIEQLTSDVTAGPGTGSQAATVVGWRGVSLDSTMAAVSDAQIPVYSSVSTKWFSVSVGGDLSLSRSGVAVALSVTGPPAGSTLINSQTGNIEFRFAGTTGAYLDKTSGDLVVDSGNASSMRVGSYWSGGVPSAGFSGIYAGANAASPGATNYAFLGTTSRTFFGATTDLVFGISNVYSLYITASGAQWFAGFTQSLGGGVGVMGITDAGTPPSTNPTGGGVLYSEGGALKWRGSSGTITTIAPA